MAMGLVHSAHRIHIRTHLRTHEASARLSSRPAGRPKQDRTDSYLRSRRSRSLHASCIYVAKTRDLLRVRVQTRLQRSNKLAPCLPASSCTRTRAFREIKEVSKTTALLIV